MDIRSVLTNAGGALILQAATSTHRIVWVKSEVGTGEATSSQDIASFTELIDSYGEAGIIGQSVSGTDLVMNLEFWNTGVETAVQIYEIGIWAKLDNQTDTEAVMFSYLTFGDYPDTILPEGDAAIRKLYNIPFRFGSGGEPIEVTPTGLISEDKASTTPQSGKLLYVNSSGKMPCSITGDAATVGGNLPSAFAQSNHSHGNATTSAAGYMSAEDKASLDTVAGRVNQNLKTDASPTFAGLTVNGVIYGARFA